MEQDRKHLLNWIARLAHAPLVIVDTETTGFGKDAEVWSVAVISYEDGERIRSDQWFASTKKPPHFKLREVNGATPERLAGYEPFDIIAPALTQAIQDTYFLGWKAEFDWRMIRQTYRMNRLTPPRLLGVECLMRAYSRGVAHWDKLALGTACKQAGIPFDETHDSLADATATAAIWDFLRSRKFLEDERRRL